MNVYNQEFWLKYTFRLGHIFTVIALGGKIISDYLFPCQQEQLTTGGKAFFAIMGVILIVCGFVNIFLLKAKDKLKDNYKYWVGTLHIKLITTIIFLTPLLNVIGNSISKDFPVKTVQFYFFIFWTVLSPFLRFYREAWTNYHALKSKQLD